MNKGFAGLRSKTIESKATVAPLTEPTSEAARCALLRDRNGSRSAADRSAPACAAELDRLYGCLDEVTAKKHPRTASLLAAGTRKIAQKVIEEAGEVALEAVKHRSGGVVRESADLLYHLVVLWRRAGVDPDEIWTEMQRRADALGIAEKLPKPAARHSKPSKA
jgi:phosphoribosyl-ATP pyrophosphohydrolase